MSVTNSNLLIHLGRMRYNIDDDRSGGALAAQAGAAPLLNAATRCTVSSAATASFILPDILTNEADGIIWVLNDSANSINVYPFIGQNMNGGANAALAVAAGGFGVFSRVSSTSDWRAAAFT